MTGDLTNSADQFLAEKAEAIRALEQEGKRVVFKVACEIGGHLSSARDRLSRNSSGDGTWLAWLEREFPYWGSQRTAYNYIGIFKFAQRHGGQVAKFANSIDLSAVYLLAAPSTPEEARTEVAGRIEHGEELTRQDVKDAIDRHRDPAKSRTRGREQPTRRSRPSAPPSSPAPAQPAPRKFTTGQTFADLTWVLAALVRSIADTTPAEVVAELDPAALIKLARDAEVAGAWLGALQVLAACAAKGAPNRPAGDVDDDLLCPSNKNAAHPRLDLFLHGSGTPVIHVDVADDRHRG
jgi:hypothetical protein